IYHEDFSGNEKGELPSGWNTGGKGELVTVENATGNWLRLYQDATYLSSNAKAFTKNFTIEFDLLLDIRSRTYSYPNFTFGFLSTNNEPSNGNKFVRDYETYSSVQCELALSSDGNTRVSVASALNRSEYFNSEGQNLASLENYYNKITHVSIQVQGTRTRIWFNGEKKFDLPMAAPGDYMFNNVFFRVYTSSYKDDEIGFYINNLRVAAGKADNRNQLMTTGKFSTTGILFDVKSAVIKPESYGAIAEIAKIFKDNPELKAKIIGHTDSDGVDGFNLQLSLKRAEAVKNKLKEFGVADANLVVEGKGETLPVGDNGSKEGRAMNRRVEFVRL
ncbi:MAG: OmpA family protein, partial [Flavitalea sp.]